MDTNSFFDIKRLKYLLLRQVTLNSRSILIGAGAILGVFIYFGTASLFFDSKTTNQVPFSYLVSPVLFICGYIFTSSIFSELNTPSKGYMFLILPTSTAEKLLSAWLLCSFGFVLFSIVIMYLLNFYLIVIASLFTSKSIAILNLFDPYFLKIYGAYIITQSVFFLGSLYFRRINFLKTMIALFILGIFVLLYWRFFSEILFKSFDGSFTWVGFSFGNHQVDIRIIEGPLVALFAKILFWGCTAPFFLLVSYYRLKEREV